MPTQVSIGVKLSGRTAWLTPLAAASYRRMVEDGCPRGGITDAGRTYAEQKALYEAYLRGETVATAARPGTSKHETGRALDLSSRFPAQAWVRRYGHKYGWMKDRVRREPWHMEYEADKDTQINRRRAPDPIEEDEMPSPKDLWDHEVGGVAARNRLVSADSRALKAQQNAAGALAEARAATAAVAALAAAQGADGATIAARIDAAVKAALKDLRIVLEVGE